MMHYLSIQLFVVHESARNRLRKKDKERPVEVEKSTSEADRDLPDESADRTHADR